MEPVEVTACYGIHGKVTPLSFTWQGREYLVEGTGRRWQAEDGLHLLVMAAGERVFELLFVPQDGCWFIKPRKPSIHRVA
jgi:hypothetical protein